MDSFSVRFIEQVRKNANKTAISYQEETISYQELDQKANSIAQILQENGVKRGDVVPIISSRSIEVYIGILAIIKIGAIYLPIDSIFPDDRIEYMLDNSCAAVALIEKCLEEKFNIIDDLLYIPLEKAEDIESVGVIQQREPNPEDPIYLIYTSGSTGVPKGVLIQHQAIDNLIASMEMILHLNSAYTMLSLTTISFDIFVFESILPLALGMHIVIIDPLNFYNDILGKRADIIQTTPTTMKLILQDKRNIPYITKITCIVLGGEPLPQCLLEEIKKLTQAKIYNVYGPTETTVWSTIKELTDKDEITIGSPILNTELFVGDRDWQSLDPGFEGELSIGGRGLAFGYWRDTEKTQEKFTYIDSPEGRKRVYRTGDIVKINSEGELIYIGRNDTQVKIRGFRIELEEIEYVIQQFPSINYCCALVVKNQLEDTLACCYIADEEVPSQRLHKYLSKKFPQYMIPQYFIQIHAIPTLPNGKLDRIRLAEECAIKISLSKETDGNEEPYTDNIAEKIYYIWSEILKTRNLDKEKSFFELGGTSILLMKVYDILINEFPFLTVADLFAKPNITMLSEFIKQQISINKIKDS